MGRWQRRVAATQLAPSGLSEPSVPRAGTVNWIRLWWASVIIVCRQYPTPTSAHLRALQTPCLACHDALREMRGGNEARRPEAQGNTPHARLPHARGLARNVKAATQFLLLLRALGGGYPSLHRPAAASTPLPVSQHIHTASQQTDWPSRPDLFQAITALSAVSPAVHLSVGHSICQPSSLYIKSVCPLRNTSSPIVLHPNICQVGHWETLLIGPTVCPSVFHLICLPMSPWQAGSPTISAGSSLTLALPPLPTHFFSSRGEGPKVARAIPQGHGPVSESWQKAQPLLEPDFSTVQHLPSASPRLPMLAPQCERKI